MHRLIQHLLIGKEQSFYVFLKHGKSGERCSKFEQSCQGCRVNVIKVIVVKLGVGVGSLDVGHEVIVVSGQVNLSLLD